ncbi:MAG: histidine kinase [Verrucomicrobiota bacterium]
MMKAKLINLSQRYQEALLNHLKQESLANLQPANRLGREAMVMGLETLDLARIHQQALTMLVLPNYSSGNKDGMIKRAEIFFVEAITPIEETHRSAMESNVHVIRLNKTLRRRSAELAASNQELKREIAQRKGVEDSLRKSERHYSLLLKQSRILQEQLRQLSRQILSVQEDERRRISRELHDVIAQTLTGINVQLAALKTEAAVNTEGLDRKIASTQRLVEKSVDIVHQFARELRPALLDDLGLIPALHSYLKDFTKRTGIHIRLTTFTPDKIQQLSNAKRTVLYRVAQAALTNIDQHAQADRVAVNFEKLRGGVRMEIHDNGRSFDVERVLYAKRNKRLGLLGMRERVEMVGGTFGVESTLGNGTNIRVEIPHDTGKGKKKPVKRSGKAILARP